MSKNNDGELNPDKFPAEDDRLVKQFLYKIRKIHARFRSTSTSHFIAQIIYHLFVCWLKQYTWYITCSALNPICLCLKTLFMNQLSFAESAIKNLSHNNVCVCLFIVLQFCICQFSTSAITCYTAEFSLEHLIF